MDEIFFGLLKEIVELILLDSLNHAIELHFAKGIHLFKQLLFLKIEFSNLAIKMALASLIFCSSIFKVLRNVMSLDQLVLWGGYIREMYIIVL